MAIAEAEKQGGAKEEEDGGDDGSSSSSSASSFAAVSCVACAMDDDGWAIHNTSAQIQKELCVCVWQVK